ncbi:type II toxin-antitoxin system death-on-curing family toxin [Elioraea sp.]|uniref:type II toxin-antitoxin system death-on-curing family toxin n=1 Tax=Elioraea sp. TaxID=2185103 RepID=UPI003F72E70F
MSEPIWLERDAILAIHAEALADHGGAPGLRDEGILESALARPQNRLAYEGSTDLIALAAAYAFGIARNHPFADGYRRTAFVAAVLFVEANGRRVEAPPDEAVAAMLSLAAGETTEAEFAAWLRARSRPR